jgi:hypothetical protein
MLKCEHCGEEVALPYKCSFCGGYFCVEHRLPENHDCSSLSPGTLLENQHLKPIAEKKMASHGELHFIRETAEMQAEKPKPKGKLKYVIPIFCVLLILATYASYTFGYNNGSNASRNVNYNLGYNNGYFNGNSTGYELGYNSGFREGNVSGFNTGYQVGVTSRGFNIVDPAYQQMLSFMATDTVHNNPYKNDTYVCWNFCNDYINEAFRAGWRCGFVYISFPVYAHAVVCFNTTDKGIVFVEPQFNEIVNVEVGLSYSRSNGFAPATYNDTSMQFGIIW